MSDDNEIDAALRRAMAALDGETPPGYFDALAARTAARLDETAGPLPPSDDDHDDPFNDDGGTIYSSQVISLADFPGPEGNAAALPRADRAVPHRVAQSPGSSDDDGDGDDADPVRFRSQVFSLARVSEPERNVVVQPHIDRASAAAVAPVESMATSARRLGSTSAAASMTSARLGRPRSALRAAGVGLGLAAAGAAIYLVASHRGTERAPSAGERSSTTTVAAVSPASAGSGSAGGSAAGSGSDTSGVAGAGIAATGSGAAEGSGTPAAPEQIGKFTGSKIDRPDSPRPPSKPGGSLRVKGGEIEGKRPAPAPGAGKTKKGKPTKQAADRTSLSSDDLERAMAAVAGRARACLAGAAASASLRLTVAPSGQIAQVAVTGPLAGTPAGACVERAVRTAAFPPWDGMAQSFDYRLPD